MTFSGDKLELVIGEATRNGRDEFWIRSVQLKMPEGWRVILEGVDGGEFSTSVGSANASKCEVVRDDTTGRTIRMSCRQDAWEAEEEIDLETGSPFMRRKQTYRFTRSCEGAVHPGFRIKTETGIRYTFPVKVDNHPLASLQSSVRAAVDHGLPMPFHVWHDDRYLAVYGLDKSESPGTLDFVPGGADGRATLRVYFPDSCPAEIQSSVGRTTSAVNPTMTTFVEGQEITLTEVIAARPLAAGNDPLLEADRLAASILLRKPPRHVDPEIVADAIARFYRNCGLWEPNALGAGKGWFRNMVVRTCTGGGFGLRFDGTGTRPEDGGIGYDLGWGEGYGVYAWTGIVRHWCRTGERDLLKYVDEMTRNMDLFKRNRGPNEPYFDTFRGGQYRAGTGGRIIWTYVLGRIGFEVIGLYLLVPDYPNPETRNRWLAAATGIGTFLALHQKPDGDLQDTFGEDDREADPAFMRAAPPHRCSARAIVCGLWTKLGKATGDGAWTERALRLARIVASEARRFEFANAHMDHGCPDAEAPAHVLGGLVPLYEATRDPEVLAACKAAAAYSISWTYLYDVPVPKTHNGVARGGQCCCRCEPIIFVIGPGIAVEPLLAMSRLTADPLYERVALEMISYIGNSQIHAPGRSWHGGIIHAFLMYRGRCHGPDEEGQVDTGMATGSSLAALEAWLAHRKRLGTIRREEE